MAKKSDRSAALWVPPNPTLPELIEASKSCQGCDLYKNATQTVFGAGSAEARLMLVGEQPGDYEDRIGQPFVGPAGRVLDKALEQAGIDRSLTYVTNTVKHFKSEPRGKRRIHKTPTAAEVAACKPWLEAEVAVIQPEVIVCLGVTASHAVLGKTFRLTLQRGQVIPHPWGRVVATVHPSSLLRLGEAGQRREEFMRFVGDLKVAARLLRSPVPST